MEKYAFTVYEFKISMWRSSNEQQGLKPSAFSIRTGHLQSVVGQIRGIKRLLKGLMLFWRKSHKEECWKRHFYLFSPPK